MIQDIQRIIDEEEIPNFNLAEQLLQTNDAKVIINALLKMILGEKIEEDPKDYKEFVEPNTDKVKLFFNLGKKDKIMAKDIIGSLSANIGIFGSEIGKIKILDKFSFVEVPFQYVDEIIKGMEGKQIKGRDVKIEVANS